jgi:uncharacterized peroxidase-related enzyme
MSWIQTIDEKEADNELKEVFASIISSRGKLSNIMKIHSLLPKTMKTHLDFYLSIMFTKSILKRQEKELIAVIVSRLNKCQYCIDHHKEALLHYWKDEKKINRLLERNDHSLLSEKQKIMASHVIKLTNAPSKIKGSDIKILKNNGFDDKVILEITLITSYFNFVNRIALGLGVEDTKEEMKGYRY